jgi:two-component system sensor histidine kinase/response regulator
MLVRLGYRVNAVADGLEAVEALRRIPHTAVLMDSQMPEDGRRHGDTTTEAIRREEAPGRPTPLIAMTASAMHGDRERCLAAGMDDYISKPVRPDDLATTLARWITQDTSACTPTTPGAI